MKDSLADNTTISHYRILSLLGAGGMGERLEFDSCYDPIRDDPRCKDLSRRLSLPE